MKNKELKDFISKYNSPNSAVSYGKSIEMFLEDKSFGTFDYNRVKTINGAINILVCILSIIIFRYKIWVYPIIYLITDITLMFLDNYLIIHYTKLSEGDLPESTIKREINKLKKTHLKKSKLYEKSKKENEICSGGNKYSYSELHSQRSEIKKLVNSIENFEGIRRNRADIDYEIMKTEEEENTLEVITNNIALNNIENYRKVILLIEQKIKESLSSDFNGYIDKSIYLSKELLSDVENNTAAFELVNITFNIYLRELIDVITQIGVLGTSQQLTYEENLKEVLNAYEEHIERLRERVKNYNQRSISVNLSTLLEELKKGD